MEKNKQSKEKEIDKKSSLDKRFKKTEMYKNWKKG